MRDFEIAPENFFSINSKAVELGRAGSAGLAARRTFWRTANIGEHCSGVFGEHWRTTPFRVFVVFATVFARPAIPYHPNIRRSREPTRNVPNWLMQPQPLPATLLGFLFPHRRSCVAALERDFAHAICRDSNHRCISGEGGCGCTSSRPRGNSPVYSLNLCHAHPGL